MLRPGIDGVKRNVSKLIQGVNGVKTEVTEYWSSEGGVKKLVYRSSPYDPVLNNNSWDMIMKASDDDVASSVWAIGDRKEVTLYGMCSKLKFDNQKYYAYIIGFNHNSFREGANRIHFQMGYTDLMSGFNISFISGINDNSDFYMNSADTNVRGWSGSFMRNTVCYTFYNCFPSDLRDVVKSTKKYSDNTGGGSDYESNVTYTEDKVFLLSEFEVFGARLFGNTSEQNYQEQYQYYKNGNSRIKYRHDSNDLSVNWWLRSVFARYNNYFCAVNASGNIDYYNANRSLGFAPAFCV